jgi:hypothetical protein
VNHLEVCIVEGHIRMVVGTVPITVNDFRIASKTTGLELIEASERLLKTDGTLTEEERKHRGDRTRAAADDEVLSYSSVHQLMLLPDKRRLLVVVDNAVEIWVMDDWTRFEMEHSVAVDHIRYARLVSDNLLLCVTAESKVEVWYVGRSFTDEKEGGGSTYFGKLALPTPVPQSARASNAGTPLLDTPGLEAKSQTPTPLQVVSEEGAQANEELQEAVAVLTSDARHRFYRCFTLSPWMFLLNELFDLGYSRYEIFKARDSVRKLITDSHLGQEGESNFQMISDDPTLMEPMIRKWLMTTILTLPRVSHADSEVVITEQKQFDNLDDSAKVVKITALQFELQKSLGNLDFSDEDSDAGGDDDIAIDDLKIDQHSELNVFDGVDDEF